MVQYRMWPWLVLLASGSLIPCPAAGPDSVTLIPSGPILLFENSSSSVFNVTSARSDIECTVKCQSIACAAISLNNATGLCQLLVLIDASKAPNGSNVRRVFGAEAANRVMKAADFEQQLRSKILVHVPAPVPAFVNLSRVFINTNLGNTGSVQSLRINQTWCYRIEARGAKGGTANNVAGGNGSWISGNFSLTAGTQLSIVVGQQGGDYNPSNVNNGAGGGGGAFVYVDADSRLLVAAGGGGGGATNSNKGSDGQAGPNGTDSVAKATVASDPAYKGFGGALGQPGMISNPDTTTGDAPVYAGGAGAGWLNSSSVSRGDSRDGQSGGSRADGWIGGLAGSTNSGADGGFGGGGGGGGGGGNSDCGSGGGGGFSGGGAGFSSYQSGGGGGSFCGGSGCVGTTGGNTGLQGSVTIRSTEAPTC